MRRRHIMLESPAMGRKMHLWCYGHWGSPILVYPTAAGFAHEWDRHGMLEVLAPLIYGGKIKLYCTESNVFETWNNKDDHPAWRVKRHMAFEEYVVSQLVPSIREDCGNPEIRVATTGASLGAYYAANSALKYPEIFHYALCLSGRYDAGHFTDGFMNTDIYFNSPLAYTSNLEGEALERVRRNTHLTVVCGRGKWEEGCIEESEALADILQAKGISHHRDIWGHDVSHDWIWWQRQTLLHFNQTFGD